MMLIINHEVFWHREQWNNMIFIILYSLYCFHGINSWYKVNQEIEYMYDERFKENNLKNNII